MLKNLFKPVSVIDKARYDIEKKHHQKMKAEYASLEKINKAYDTLTLRAEKEFETKERSFVKAKKQHDQLRLEKETALKQKQAQQKKQSQDAIASLKKHHKALIEGLKLNHRKSLLMAENERDALEQEKQLALKEIEKSFSENTELFENKLQFFTKNLKKNQLETEKKFSQSLRKLKEFQQDTLYATPLLEAFYEALETLESDLNQSYKDTQSLNQEEKKAILKRFKEQRSQLNKKIKAMANHVSKVQERFHRPFIDMDTTLDTYITEINTELEEFIKIVETDFAMEAKRIDEAMKDQEIPPTAKELKDFKTRLKLTEQRKATLIKNCTILSNLVEKDIASLSHHFVTTKALIKETFEGQHTLISTIHQQYKQHFSTLETFFSALFDTHDKTLKDNHDITQLHRFKSLTKNLFTVLSEFEKQRIDLIIEMSNAALPKFKAIDEISTYLDTVEPLKEIEISKQKLIIEQENYGYRYDMRMAKMQYEIDIKEAEHQFHIEEQNRLDAMAMIQEEQKHQDLVAKHQAETARLEKMMKDTESKIIFSLRKNTIEHELSISEKKHELDQQKHAVEHAIAHLTIEKEGRLNQLEIEKEISEKTAQIRTDSEHQRQILKLSLEKEKQLKKQIELHYHEVLKERESAYNEALEKVSKKLDDTEKSYHANVEFIHRALEKETLQPKQQIKELKTLAHHRIQQITHLEPTVFTPLSTTKDALSLRDTELKKLLLLIAKPYLRAIEEYISALYQITEESEIFVHSIKQKIIESDENLSNWKRNARLQKEQQLLDKHLKDDEKQKEQLQALIIPRLKDARTLIYDEKNTTMQHLKQIIAPLVNIIEERLLERTETIKKRIQSIFKSLYDNESLMIERAKEQQVIALENAKKDYLDQLKPLEVKRDKLLADKTQALAEVDDLKVAALEKKLEPIHKTLSEIRDTIKRLDTERQSIEDSFEGDFKLLEQELKNKLKQLKATHASQEETFQQRHLEKITKLQTKLDDAKHILEYELRIHQNEAEHYENVLAETLQQNHYQASLKLKQFEQQLEQTKYEKDRTYQDAKDNLEATNQRYEEQMMRTSARMDAASEQVSREIQQIATLKQGEKERLIRQLKDIEETLNQTLKERLDGVQKELKNTLGQFFQDDQNNTYQDVILQIIKPYKTLRIDLNQAILLETSNTMTQQEG